MVYPRVDVIVAGQHAPEPEAVEPQEVPADEPKPKPSVKK